MGSKWLTDAADMRPISPSAMDITVIPMRRPNACFGWTWGLHDHQSGDSSWTLVRDTMNYQFILTDCAMATCSSSMTSRLRSPVC